MINNTHTKTCLKKYNTGVFIALAMLTKIPPHGAKYHIWSVLKLNIGKSSFQVALNAQPNTTIPTRTANDLKIFFVLFTLAGVSEKFDFIQISTESKIHNCAFKSGSSF